MRFPIDKIRQADDGMSMNAASFFRTRPAGILVLGMLYVLFGLGNLLSPLDRPVLAGGALFTERSAVILHVGVSTLGIYLGYGLLKPLRYTWNIYLLSAWTGIMSLALNLLRDAKLWEFSLFLEIRSERIPRFVSFSRESHVLLIGIYALTGLYIYSQRSYFWGDDAT